MSNLYAIKRFASKTSGVTFSEVYADEQYKQFKVTTPKFVVKISVQVASKKLGLILCVAGETVLMTEVESQKDAIQFITGRAEVLADTIIERLQHEDRATV